MVGAQHEAAHARTRRRREARIERSGCELERLRRDVAAWRASRAVADRHGRHATQLASVELAVETILDAIAGELGAVAPAAPTRDVYERCRQADGQVVFARRLWAYFRDRWAQRDDQALGPTLAAADELVWSCHAQACRALGCDPGPPPLTFVDEQLSPYAVERPRPPEPLRPSDSLLRDALDELPVPAIAIPAACVAQPWTLVAVAHEVGHHLPHAGGRWPPEEAPGALDAAAGPATSALWDGWRDELLADAYASAMVGAAHRWALVELELGADETMTRFSPTHPPPVVRHALVRAILDELGIPPSQSLPELDAPVTPGELDADGDVLACVDELLGDVPRVAAALARPAGPGGESLAAALGVDVSQLRRDGEAEWWRRRLAADGRPPVRARLDAPRLAAVGGAAEWVRIESEADPGRRGERADRLAPRLLEAVAGSREPGTRAGADRPAGTRPWAERLARAVLALPADDLAEQADRPRLAAVT
jgi:hypothetical protein